MVLNCTENFNANECSNKKQFPIFSSLSSNNLSSLFLFHNIIDSTWSNNRSQSQIDDIWCSNDMILDLDYPILIDTTGISDSDHKIISTTWHTNFIPTTPRCKRKKRKIFLYNKIMEDN